MKPTIAPALSRHGARAGANLFDEMIVDNFAGAGGASMGIEAAVGRSVDIAINHDRHSVAMHQLNHPHTCHLCEDVWDVDPREATAGRSVGLAWFSPDCRHFSRAKGGKPVEKKIRGLAWVVIKWAKAVKPRVIILENVREFQDWGPLTAESKPCPARKGLTFRRWLGQLRNLGYTVEYRVLNAADFGAPTHRRRFFLVARCDGRPIAWPEPTHGPGRKRPYRTAAECIDWSLPCPSIFLTKPEARALGVIRPLAEKTMRRIAMGLKRYVLENPKPFIVTCNHGGPEFRGQAVAQLAHGGNGTWGDSRAKDPREPLGTVHAGGNNHAVAAPYMVEVQNASNETGHRSVDRPAHTVTANPKGGGVALVAPTLIQTGYGEREGQAPRALDIEQPIGTLVGSQKHALCSAFLAKHYGGDRGNCAGRAIGADGPIGTVTTSDHHSVVAANMIKMNHGEKQWSGVDEPVRTILSGANHHGVAVSHLTKFYGKSNGSDAAEPMPTVTGTHNHIGEVRAFLTKYYGNGDGQPVDKPMHTITSKDRLGVVTIHGHEYQIVDIGLRMLTPAELLRAQFGKYAKGYILTGTKSQQVAKIGNSVPPELAEAVVRANYGAEREEVEAA